MTKDQTYQEIKNGRYWRFKDSPSLYFQEPAELLNISAPEFYEKEIELAPKLMEPVTPREEG